MTPEKKKIIPLVFAGTLFLLSGIAAFQDGDLVVGYMSFVISLINVVAVFLVHKYPQIVTIVLFFMDAVAAVTVGIMMILAGKQYLQYAWFVAAIGYVIAAVMTVKYAKIADEGA